MFVVTLILCAIALTGTLIAASGRSYKPALALQPLVFLVALSLIGGFPLLLLPLLLGGLCLAAISGKLRYSAFAGAAVALTLVAIVVGSIPAVNTVRERVAQREDYPFEDMSVRLESFNATPVEAPALAAAAAENLDRLESQLASDSWQGSMRARSIRRLHEDAVTQFVDAPGFGFSRMPTFSTPRTEPDPGPIALPEPPYVPQADVLIGSSRLLAPAPSATQLQAMHEVGVMDFVNQAGFGYQKSVREVAGFESHRFRTMPTISAQPSTDTHGWLLVRLELVSLLEHPQPCVYESRSLPRMDDLQQSPVRALNDFETSALQGLQNGEDIVTHDSSRRLVALGSLRATQQCLDCHAAERGALLGAFSYEFVPQQPPGNSDDGVAQAPPRRLNGNVAFHSILALDSVHQ